MAVVVGMGAAEADTWEEAAVDFTRRLAVALLDFAAAVAVAVGIAPRSRRRATAGT